MLFLLGKFPFFDHVTRLFLEILNGKTLSFSLVSPSEKSAKFQLNLLNTLEVINREVKLVKKNLSGTSGYPSSEWEGLNFTAWFQLFMTYYSLVVLSEYLGK